MLTQSEWAKLNPTPLASGIVEVFALNNPVIQYMPYASIAGNAYKYNTEATLPDVAFRAVGGSYTEAVGTINPTTENLTILGADSDYDTFHLKAQTGDASTRAAYDALTAKAISLKHLTTFFAGDSAVDTNSFDGLAKRLTGSQVVSAGTNGAVLTLDMLDSLIDAVQGTPSVLLMSKALRRAVTKLARGTANLNYSIDQFGRQIDLYAGIPIGIVEKDAAGAEILGFTETQGSSSIAASIYAARFDLDALHGIQTEPLAAGVRDLGELDSKPASRTRIEWYQGLVVKTGKAAARLKGVLAS